MIELPRPHLIAFIDESGDFELKNLNPRYPVCAQCALTCTVAEYLAKAVPSLMEIKYSFFGNECVVFHGYKLRQRSPPFEILRDDDVREEFMQAVAWAVGRLDGCLIVAAVHKPRHINQYLYPDDPFYLSLKFLLERLHMHWVRELEKGQRLLCVFEARGKAEDKRTRQWFRQICDGDNHSRSAFPFDIDFRTKEQNVIGHQYADLVAYAACRFIETGDAERTDWKAVVGKLRRVGGEYMGHGLKVFPE